MPKESKKALLKLIKEKSYKEGDFRLVSGERSNFYLDLKEITLSQKGLQLIGELAFEQVTQLNTKPHAVGGMTLGADPLAVAIMLEAAKNKQPLDAFIVRKEAKRHGSNRQIEGAKNFPRGARVVVVEDVTTTGKSAMQAISALKEGGFQVKAILSVVDRKQGAKELFAKEKIPFFSLCTLQEVQEFSEDRIP